MKILISRVLLILIILWFSCLKHEYTAVAEPVNHYIADPDTSLDNQTLYNGRIWKNLYYKVHDNQFLFSTDFLQGTVSVRSKIFEGIRIRYDILTDEIQIPVYPQSILQLNKEIVDSFSLLFNSKVYHFDKIPENGVRGLKGYANVLYRGKSVLYLKSVKKIEHPKAEGDYDTFFQTEKIYFVNRGIAHLISGRGDLMNAMAGQKDLIKAFIRKNKTDISVRDPESLIPVIRYYDTLSP